MKESILKRIDEVLAERQQFELLAPIRAEERVQALMSQLQGEITLRLQAYDDLLEELRKLAAMVDGEGKEMAG
jgi:hypothetical protein